MLRRRTDSKVWAAGKEERKSSLRRKRSSLLNPFPFSKHSRTPATIVSEKGENPAPVA